MKIQVISPEIGDSQAELNHDFWVRKAANEAIEELGHEALSPESNEVPDIQLVFVGMNFHQLKKKVTLKGRFTAAWLYSKPNEVRTHKGNLNEFHQLYTLTTMHAKAFKQETGLITKPLRIAIDKEYRPRKKDYSFDVVYMGTKISYRAQIIKALANKGYRIGLAGYGWGRQPHKNLRVIRQFWPNNQFAEFFNQAPLSIYPTKREFAGRGIVPIRVADIYASSDCLCLCPINQGLKEAFAVPPPQYEDIEALLRMVQFYLDHPTKRDETQTIIREGLKMRSYKDLILEVIVDAMSYWSKG